MDGPVFPVNPVVIFMNQKRISMAATQFVFHHPEDAYNLVFY
ncbi:hypothetical protein SAMN05216302_1001272 [Nitrosomonas aestuarii]|uniref:Uncharacterized protein n=1 Tax=Nitrosomonas aestuarii TaxID=52441 RepID=A0A1I3XFU9_9PROT|nr:hypothetical protein SAMN05216302_1001272 [Nitrosomonas aestuarii]